MNHDFIAAHDVIARYAADRLSVDQEREFEAHLVDCAQCAGEVEQELALGEGLRAVAAERTAAPQPAAPGRWSSSLRLLQAAAVLLVAVALGLALSLARTTSALNTAFNEREEQRRRADETARTAQGLEQRIAGLEAQVTRRSPEALLPTTVFALTAVRGGADGGAIDTLTLDRGQSARLVVLTVDVPPGEDAVTLKDAGGRAVWSGGRFRPSSQDVMAVAVERSVLADGRYTLEVHRGDAAGQTTPAARYRFQISSR